MSACIDGLRLISILDSSTFEEAQSSCVLAVPTTREKFSRIQDIATTEGRNFWIGLNDPIGQIVGSNSDTTRFLNSIDSRLNPFTAGEVGLFPWGAGRPDNGINGEDCVAVTDTGTLDDRTCNSQLSFICEEFCEDPPPVIFEEGCVDDVQLFFVNRRKNIEGALVDCLRTDASATLAIPRNASDYNRIIDSCPNGNCWVGVIDFAAQGGTDPSRFISMENEVLAFIEAQGTGTFPWRAGRPDDGTGNQDCAVITNEGVLDDEPCFTSRFPVCERPCRILDDEILSLSMLLSFTGIILCLLVGHVLVIKKLQASLNVTIKEINSYLFFGQN